MNSSTQFRAYLKAASGSPGSGHLTEARMIAYCQGRLSGTEREAAQAHLVACGQCVQLFRDARDFLEPAGEEELEGDVTERDEIWQSLRAQLPQQARPKTVPLDSGRRRFAFGFGFRPAMAAALLILFGTWSGIATWRMWQEKQARQQAQELAAQISGQNKELAELLQSGGDQLQQMRERLLAVEAQLEQLKTQPGETQQIPSIYIRRLSEEKGPDDELQLHLRAADKTAWLALVRSAPYEFQEYGIELIDPGGQKAQEFTGLRPLGDEGSLNLKLTPATLTTGKYKVRLFGQRGKTRQRLGEYNLSVTVTR